VLATVTSACFASETLGRKGHLLGLLSHCACIWWQPELIRRVNRATVIHYVHRAQKNVTTVDVHDAISHRTSWITIADTTRQLLYHISFFHQKIFNNKPHFKLCNKLHRLSYSCFAFGDAPSSHLAHNTGILTEFLREFLHSLQVPHASFH
jgi:hypothetical protein